MQTPIPPPCLCPIQDPRLPSALEAATHAVTLLEDNPLFNSARGAVFTRDGTNELEASVMVSRGRAKRGVGVSGLRHVRNPVLLARAVLERGDEDLAGRGGERRGQVGGGAGDADPHLDVPSAQGHTLIYGATAEVLARHYGLELVDPSYFFTQRRWDEHIRALKRSEEARDAEGEDGSATWSRAEFLPQGTCGAIVLDADGVVCAATSTGGMTNKLTGRIGDTPVVGAGFWAEEWVEDGDPSGAGRTEADGWEAAREYLQRPATAVVTLSASLRGLMADCLPTPCVYRPVPGLDGSRLWTTRSMAVSGTGNGDSFMRIDAVRTVGAIARFSGVSTAVALTRVAGPQGELQKSAEERWGKTGEGEGGMIGIECAVVRDIDGNVVETRGEVVQAHNCGGMFRAWIDDEGKAVARVWREDEEILGSYEGGGATEELRSWAGEKALRLCNNI